MDTSSGVRNPTSFVRNTLSALSVLGSNYRLNFISRVLVDDDASNLKCF